MMTMRCSLLPLGRLQDHEALNVWEHIAFSEWLELHARPGDVLREMWQQEAFEEEAKHWESLVFYGHLEAATLYDGPLSEDEAEDFFHSDSDYSDYY